MKILSFTHLNDRNSDSGFETLFIEHCEKRCISCARTRANQFEVKNDFLDIISAHKRIGTDLLVVENSYPSLLCFDILLLATDHIITLSPHISSSLTVLPPFFEELRRLSMDQSFSLLGVLPITYAAQPFLGRELKNDLHEIFGRKLLRGGYTRGLKSSSKELQCEMTIVTNDILGRLF